MRTDALGIIDAAYRFACAHSQATTTEARARLRESARAIERARCRTARARPHDRRVRDLGGIESLAPRERCAVGFAALGHSNELIAYEMGIAPSTVAVLLTRAARRLGTRSRAELLRKYVEATTRRS